MGPHHDLKKIISELDRLHSENSSWDDDYEFMEFVTARNGLQRHFSRNTKKHLRGLAKSLHDQRPKTSIKIEVNNYQKLVRQAVANLHSEGYFENYQDGNFHISIFDLSNEIENYLEGDFQEFIHHFPAWTIGMEKIEPFTLDPVTFLKRIDWIDSIDLHPIMHERFASSAEDSENWKILVKQALLRPRDNSSIGGLSDRVYDAIIDCPSIVKVKISGHEKELSRKLAKLVCRTALDSISLLFGSSDFFHQQALHGERLSPVSTETLTEADGKLWLQGPSLGKRLPILPPKEVTKILKKNESILSSFGHILNGLTSPLSHPHPELSNRWATALDWYGEGSREPSDSIAVAKLSTCLDVLAGGGKAGGITKMMSNLTGLESSFEMVKEPQSQSLGYLIKKIYNEGRSKILHGTHFDRLESFAEERKHAAHIARIALIRSSLCLKKYTGKDFDQAFSAMTNK